MSRRRIKLLFIAEAVTLAHVARPLSLASQLDPDRYEIVIACDPRYRSLWSDGPWRNVDIWSIPSASFLRALAAGSPVYDAATLHRYVEQDRGLLESLAPDVVIGDFRISLSVSARLAGIPYATITNGYWSPACSAALPMPVLPMTRWLPLPVARLLFAAAKPFAFPLHCRPLNTVRESFGLPSLGNDLRRIYTDADHVFCADAYELIEPSRMPANHDQLGPLLWSPRVEPPRWWDQLPTARPLVYVTLGSSGPASLLGMVLDALEAEELCVMASTAGGSVDIDCPPNARLASYLDGDAACARSDLVICNGGSPTTQQALAAGVPTLGLPGNADQLLNMESLKARGAGDYLRADRANASNIGRLARRLMASASYRRSAAALRSDLNAAVPAATVFGRSVEKLLAVPDRSPLG